MTYQPTEQVVEDGPVPPWETIDGECRESFLDHARELLAVADGKGVANG